MVFDFLKKYGDYFYSLRQRKNHVYLLDMVFPKTWSVSEYLVSPVSGEITSQVENEDIYTIAIQSEDLQLVSDKLIESINNIIERNLERIEKERLLQERIDALKQFVENNDIETISKLSF